ncbi:MAG: hypothetical protein IKO11_04675, partial [Lachnospiraceae bacterium]|nr:hypothetical protein [Lachnospiraceae bacterium]
EARVCVLEMHGDRIYLAACSAAEEVTVARGKNRTGIGRQKLEIRSGDIIELGSDYLKLTMVDKNG